MRDLFNNSNLYPTPLNVIEIMITGETLTGKTILEPSAGLGHIVDYCCGAGANVIACEISEDLKKILATKCPIIGNDFLTIESHAISHIDYIIMNPPFDTADKHITHAYNIAPPGCKIIALCNSATLENCYTATRKELKSIIASYGEIPQDLGDCFAQSERTTQVNVSLIKILKPGSNYNTEFAGFFLEEDEEEIQENGIMNYNVVRDLVNRYVGAVKIFDKQLSAAVEMNDLTTGFFSAPLGMSVTKNGEAIKRNEFKKEMQKSGWNFIFKKMNMAKYATRGLKEDINKFVEKQTEIPFTMRNIYKMLDIVIGTHGSRMDKALEEVFDKITSLSKDNQFNLPGFQTNSHYLVNPKFIIDNMCYQDKRWYTGSKIETSWGASFDLIEDFVKALCYLTGDKYDAIGDLRSWITNRYKVITDTDIYFCRDTSYTYESHTKKMDELYKAGIKHSLIDHTPIYGEWFEWSYFKVKAFKKGTMHFEFKDNELWAQFNLRVSKIKGYPLFEGKEQTAWQKQQNKRA